MVFETPVCSPPSPIDKESSDVSMGYCGVKAYGVNEADELIAKLALHCYNSHKGTNLQLMTVTQLMVRSVAHFDYQMTLNAIDPANNSFSSVEICAWDASIENDENLRLVTTFCSLEGSGEKGTQWDFDGVDMFYNGVMPKWLDDGTLTGSETLHYYEVNDSDLQENEWLHLYAQVGAYSKWDLDMVNHFPLEIKKAVVQTKEDDIESSLKLKSSNAIFYITFTTQKRTQSNEPKPQREKMSEEQPHANLAVPAFKTEKDPITQTQNGQSSVWRFGGSDKAAKASTVTLRGVIYMLFDNCSKDVNKTILPLGHGDPSVYPCFRTCIEAEDAVVDVLRSGKGNSYGPGAGILPARRAVAEYMNRDLPHKLTPEDIFLTAGCNQGIEIVFESLARPNANILLPRPGFPHYDARAAYSGLEVRKFDLLPEKEWEIDIEGIEAIADENTVAMVVINPNNPCGNVYSHDHLKKVAETARKLGIMVISDEVYDQTIFGDNPFVPMGKFASFVPVLTLAGISKGWVVPGWKIGWIALNDPEGIFETTKVVQSIKQNLDVTPDPATIIQAALPAILEKADKNFFAKKNKILKHNVDLVCDRLKDIPCVVCPKKPESCTYLLTKLELSLMDNIKDDIDFCVKLAREENLVFLPGDALGLKNWMRITIGVEAHMLEDALERLKGFCTRHAKKTETETESLQALKLSDNNLEM
ncbi:Aminotransferase class I/classII [Arabidopsis suecica]|uniref:Aminotransferase class I/classII n=1 Tax=Arabidopsis suecica TaxID=45249 RepID=A0A8T2BGG0_ARASU|nr:Aminotransferase class I/classII [Arabidopsis suecica]